MRRLHRRAAHRWIPSSLVASTCSRCGARCTYRGAEVVYGSSSSEPRCRIPQRPHREMVRVELAPAVIDQVIAHAAREGVSVDTAIRRNHVASSSGISA